MPIQNYGVLKGIIVDGKEERENNRPHYQIHVKGERNQDYRVAINVKSGHKQSQVLYLADEQFNASSIMELTKLKHGFTPINKNNQELALDYIRGNLIENPLKMKALPHDKKGSDNDLNDFLQKYVKMAMNEGENIATIYAYGSLFESNYEQDRIFHFQPALGIHNVHMNQGNVKRKPWGKDNGIWQDGGILIQIKDKWIAIFLAFLTQSWHTDENGHPL